MHCRTCDYPLWNLRTRTCPECGDPFTPSEFEFTPNAVRFLCAHCGQSYYGTGPRGELVPQRFSCVKCAAAIAMDEMVLLPAEGVDERQTKPNNLPWLSKSKFWSRWWGTIAGGMLSPKRMGEAVPAEDHLGRSLGFLMLNTLVAAAMIWTIPMGVIAFIALLTGSSDVGGPLAMAFIPLGVTIVSMPIFVLIWAGIAHGLLRITGQTSAGVGRTFQIICYSSGPILVSSVPCLGIYMAVISLIWWSISAILMLTTGQKVSGGRSSFATLTWPALWTVAVVGSFAAMMFATMSAIGTMGGPGGAWTVTNAQSDMQAVQTALLTYRNANGDWPAHAGELLAGDIAAAHDFIASDTATSTFHVRLGNGTLADYDQLGPTAQKEWVAIESSRVPANAVAHRFGDFVFTYHGVNESMTPSLWIAVLSPDPVVAASSNSGGFPVAVTYVALQLDGTTVPLTVDSLPGALAAQNALRASDRLAPLPNPDDVQPGEIVIGTFDDVEGSGGAQGD